MTNFGLTGRPVGSGSFLGSGRLPGLPFRIFNAVGVGFLPGIFQISFRGCVHETPPTCPQGMGPERNGGRLKRPPRSSTTTYGRLRTGLFSPGAADPLHTDTSHPWASASMGSVPSMRLVPRSLYVPLLLYCLQKPEFQAGWVHPLTPHPNILVAGIALARHVKP